MKHNPFRARRIRPGEIPYFFSDGHTVGELTNRLVANRRGQILGPHGTGKSTLLQHLASELRKRDYHVVQAGFEPSTPRRAEAPSTKTEIRNAEEPIGSFGSLKSLRQLRKKVAQLRRDVLDKKKIIITVDGCDMASWWDRFLFLRAANKARCGVLVTTHRDLGLPTIWETKSTVENTMQVVTALIQEEIADSDEPEAEHARLTVPNELICELLARHDGDVREVLFSLYDWYRESPRD